MSLVVYSSSGTTVLLTPEDLTLPDDFRGKPWFEKQWAALTPIWTRRVLNEAKLQKGSAADVVAAMRAQLLQRWDQRKQAKKQRNAKRQSAAHAKRDRNGGATRGADGGHSSSESDGDDNSVVGAGRPSRRVDAPAADRILDMRIAAGCGIRVSNFTSLEAFQADTDAVEELIADIAAEMDKYGQILCVRHDILLDGRAVVSRSEPGGEGSEQEPAPDHRVVLDLVFNSAEEARVALSATHDRFFDGRRLRCSSLHAGAAARPAS